jgi:hypothetical protein
MHIQSLLMPRHANAMSQILDNTDRPLTRRRLHQKADKFIAEAIASTCLWDRSTVPPLGDYHSAVFYARPAHNVGVNIQFWSLPGSRVLLQVSWDAEHAPSTRWMPSDLPAQMERLGFEQRGPSDYQRELKIRSMRDVGRVARLVIDMLYDSFKYRGLFPIEAQVVFDGRAAEALIYTSFTPHEIAQIAMSAGYAARVLPASDCGDATATVMLRKGSVAGEVVLGDRVEANLYASGFVGSPVVRLMAKRGARTALCGNYPSVRPDAWRVGVSLHFEGGVTADWVGLEIARGMELIASTARRTRGRFADQKFARHTESDLYRSLLTSLGLTETPSASDNGSLERKSDVNSR